MTNEATHNLKVAPLDDERVVNDELVISIGTTKTISLNRLKGSFVDQWYRNIVMDDLEYDDKDLLSYVLELAKNKF